MSDLPTIEPVCTEHEGQPCVEQVVEGRPSRVGTFSVTRLLPSVRHRTVGPFVFLDHMGPVELAPGEGFDVKPHPHIGLSTVTYLLAGRNLHRDSLGTVQLNLPGDLNLMTAGRGVAHSERADDAGRAQGGSLHGLQLWLGLPRANEEDEPSFAHHPVATLPAVRPAPGVKGRVVLGAAFGEHSPATHPSQPLLVDLQLAPGALVTLAAEVSERGVYVVEGAARVGGLEVRANQLAVLRAGVAVPVEAVTACRLAYLGGPPLDGPRYLDWNFVSSRPERLEQAVRDWKERRFAPIPGDDAELIPYPDLPGRHRPRS
jgi:redox-sensitive bicupin YhaK (pirin superfamily)